MQKKKLWLPIRTCNAIEATLSKKDVVTIITPAPSSRLVSSCYVVVNFYADAFFTMPAGNSGAFSGYAVLDENGNFLYPFAADLSEDDASQIRYAIEQSHGLDSAIRSNQQFLYVLYEPCMHGHWWPSIRWKS
jgi:hypothetical protein